MNKKLNKNKGITLIALVISIIVMLILVAVSITMAVNGGLFNYAGKAAVDTKNAIDKEKELADGRIKIGEKWYDSIDKYLANEPSENQGDGTTPGEDDKIEIPEGLKVGDYVNYTPTEGTYTVASGENGSGYASEQSFTTETGENALQWRVWSIDEEKGTVELISATAAQTSKKLYLEGADGYNHAVDILNDMCKALYSNTNGATARSINVEDINAKTTYDVTTYSNYGTVYTPSSKQYPKIYAKELGSTENGLEETGNLLTGSEGVRNSDGTADYKTYTGSSTPDTLYATYTYYNYTPESNLKTDQGVKTVPTGLINLGEYYWLASRCVTANSRMAAFYMRIVNTGGGVDRYDQYNSYGTAYSDGNACRPVVSLNSNVSLTLDETNTTESVTYWNIKY